jgi:hypothetical protein
MRRTDPYDQAADVGRPALADAADRVNSAAPLLFVLLWSGSFLGTRVGPRHMLPVW